jgi:hypothetical protein
MRASTLGTCTKLLVVLTAVTLLAGTASAAVNGAIFTTTFDGKKVNGNIYDAKTDVYLNGGPQNDKDPGLVPDGNYYFQVTDPSGAVLLSSDDVTCREVVVLGGRIVGVPAGSPANPPCLAGAFHKIGTPDPANGQTPVQLFPFNDTPNPGGEYKAWLTPVASYSPGSCVTGRDAFGFCDSASKTDNFKVKRPSVANITVCKFQACTVTDDTGTCNGTPDPLLSGWTIDATGADQAFEVTAGSGEATPFGCATFTVSSFTGGKATVGLTEVLQNGWTQTAPDSNTPGSSQCSPTGTVGSPAGETCTVSPGDNIAAANFGNVKGTAGVGPTVVKTANGSFNTTFTWTVAKSVDNTKVFTAGGSSATVNYTVTVTHDDGTVSNVKVAGDITISNPNPFPITVDAVTDQLSDGTVCSVTGGSAVSISANSNVDLPYGCSLSALPTGELDNIALITWSDQSGAFNGVPFNLVGGSATFTVTNIFFANGVIDGSVTVTDTLDGVQTTLGTVSSTDPSPTTFTFPETFSDKAGTCTTHTNTASITTSTGKVTTTTDPVKVTDCQGADLQVSKTAATAFNSNITKGVSKTAKGTPGSSAEIDQSSLTPPATFYYTVKVTTSGWTVSGSMTVKNPNDWEDIVANVSDVLSDGGGSCTVTGGTGVTIPRSSSVTLAYSCSFASVPSAGSGTNTATATWDKTTYSTPDGLASGTASYAFGSLTITDTFKGATNTLGTVTIPPGSATFTYTRTVPIPTTGCQTYPNTATIVETGQTASASVKVCRVPAKTGALTMGFWRNKNGQGIILNHSGLNCLALKAYLNGYDPFSDLTATTCGSSPSLGAQSASGVVGYVYIVIKSATCSGPSDFPCNAMLKAQMLATALDVYFSDPTLGGNRIGAPAPIGGVLIDLTKICQMIDGSGGTSTCSGVFENVSSAFGGTTSLSVSAMLAYQNTADPAADGGNVWYGNVKAIQVLAKDAFDAINNRVAFTP